MRRRPQLAAAARRDLDEIWHWIAQRDGAPRAREFVRGLLAHLDLLAERPMLGRPRPDLGQGRRSLVFHSHVAIYRLHNGRLLVERVVHGARDYQRLFRRPPRN